MGMEVNTFAFVELAHVDDPSLEADSLQWKDETVEKLQSAIEDYLQFETPRNLMKLVADLL